MVKVTPNQIPIEDIITSLREPDCGAVISYLGTVRSFVEGRPTRGLSFDVDDRTMQTKLEEVTESARSQFAITECAIVHRTGSFEVGDDILLIAISSAHRGPAFDACLHAIDRIKELHDVWKHEDLA